MPTGTNTFFFIAKSAIPQGRKVTYAQMVASIRPTKDKVNRVRITVGGDSLDLPGATTTHCASSMITLGGNIVGVSFGTLGEGVGQSVWSTPVGEGRSDFRVGAVGGLTVTLKKMRENAWMAAN